MDNPPCCLFPYSTTSLAQRSDFTFLHEFMSHPRDKWWFMTKINQVNCIF